MLVISCNGRLRQQDWFWCSQMIHALLWKGFSLHLLLCSKELLESGLLRFLMSGSLKIHYDVTVLSEQFVPPHTWWQDGYAIPVVQCQITLWIGWLPSNALLVAMISSQQREHFNKWAGQTSRCIDVKLFWFSHHAVTQVFRQEFWLPHCILNVVHSFGQYSFMIATVLHVFFFCRTSWFLWLSHILHMPV